MFLFISCCKLVIKSAIITIKFNDSSLLKNIAIQNLYNSTNLYQNKDTLNNTLSLNFSQSNSINKIVLIDARDSIIIDSIYNIKSQNKLIPSFLGTDGCGSSEEILISFLFRNTNYSMSNKHSILIPK